MINNKGFTHPIVKKDLRQVWQRYHPDKYELFLERLSIMCENHDDYRDIQNKICEACLEMEGKKYSTYETSEPVEPSKVEMIKNGVTKDGKPKHFTKREPWGLKKFDELMEKDGYEKYPTTVSNKGEQQYGVRKKRKAKK